MHMGNVWAAHVADGNDLLAAGLQDLGTAPQLGLREIEALTLVETHSGCSSEWLRKRVGLSQSGTVRLVDRLVSLGLLRRARSHGREVALTVTPQARRILRRWSTRRDEAMTTALAALSVTERKTLTDLLAKALLGGQRVRSAADRTCRTCDWAACEPSCPVDGSVTEE
jgi:DNA-binding MarR family transcriptional regulator